MGGAFLLAMLLHRFGRFELARPIMFSVTMIGVTIAMRWKLKVHVWFWITVAFLTALHVPLILFVPWTTKWIPALVLIPFGTADLYVMLWVISIVGKSQKEPMTTQIQGSHSHSTRKVHQDQEV